MPKIKCLLVDDHTLFRQGVRRLLESNHERVMAQGSINLSRLLEAEDRDHR